MSYSNIKGVVFDLGSTLIEYENRSWAEISYDGQKRGYAFLQTVTNHLPDFEVFNARLEEIKESFRLKARESLAEWQAAQAPEELFRQLGLENSRVLSRRFIDVFYTAVKEQISMVDGALETLKAIKARGYKTGLISNTIYPGLKHEGDVAQYDLMRYLDFRIYSSEYGFRKPHKDIFAAGLELIGLPPEDIVYVGDRMYEDVGGSRAAGMASILKMRPDREYSEPLPDGVAAVHHLPEILKLLENH